MNFKFAHDVLSGEIEPNPNPYVSFGSLEFNQEINKNSLFLIALYEECIKRCGVNRDL